MYSKPFFLIIVAFFIGVAASAQDKIIKKNGEIIEARVSVINQENIVFKRYDNLGGPEYSIPKADVSRIKYTDGTEDIFQEDNDAIGVKRHDMGKSDAAILQSETDIYRNIISVAPLAITENGLGISFSLERMLDKKGIVNFYMPVFATFKRNTDAYSNNVTTYPMIYVMPGLKVYTDLYGKDKIKFSLGPSLVFAAGSGNLSTENYSTGQSNSGTVTRIMIGAMGHIGLNVFPAPRLFMGAEFGLGFSYFNEYGSLNQGPSTLVQLALKVGYRFGGKHPSPKKYN